MIFNSILVDAGGVGTSEPEVGTITIQSSDATDLLYHKYLIYDSETKSYEWKEEFLYYETEKTLSNVVIGSHILLWTEGSTSRKPTRNDPVVFSANGSFRLKESDVTGSCAVFEVRTNGANFYF